MNIINYTLNPDDRDLCRGIILKYLAKFFNIIRTIGFLL